MSELSSRLLCVAYGMSIVSVTYIYKYFAKSFIFKQKAKLEDGRTSIDEMTMQEELTYYQKKQHLKDLAKSLIAIAITFILTVITFAFYCKSSILECLRKNGFSNVLIDAICNLLLTLLLNSVLFAVVIYKNYVNTTKLKKIFEIYQTFIKIKFKKRKGQFGMLFNIFKSMSLIKKDIIVKQLTNKLIIWILKLYVKIIKAPFVEEWVFKVLFSIILGKQNYFNIQWFSPLVFSLCHFQLVFFFKSKYGWVGALVRALALSVMTFVFGIYSSFIFIKTNSFLCSFLLHGYCNFLGPPQFSSKKEIALNLVCAISFFVLMNYVPFILE
ncbi:hypothetical protein ABPG72_017993 [Tetrahymena utriculariae]